MGRETSPLFFIMEQDPTDIFIHQLNQQAHELNKGMVQKSASMQEVPLKKDIYKEHRQAQPARPVPQPVPVPQQAPVPQQPVVQQDLSPLIDRITSVEKQITKFVNLLERNVAKNAKEINIRIKLNENNDSTDKQ